MMSRSFGLAYLVVILTPSETGLDYQGGLKKL